MKQHIVLIEHDREGYAAFMSALETLPVNCKVTYTQDYDHALEILPYLPVDYIFIHLDVRAAGAAKRLSRLRYLTRRYPAQVIAYDDHVSAKMIDDALACKPSWEQQCSN